VGTWVYMHDNLIVFLDVTPRGVAVGGSCTATPGIRAEEMVNWVAKLIF